MELKNMISDGEKVQVFECGGKCAKVFKDPNVPKSVFLYEALTHTRVEETGCRHIPAFEEITKTDGKWVIVYGQDSAGNNGRGSEACGRLSGADG